MKELTNKTVKQLVSGLEAKEFTCLELIRAYIDNIQKKDVLIGAYLEADLYKAEEQAKYADLQREKGRHTSPLCGIPFAVKDNICAKETKTTCASRILEGFTSPYDATVISNLKSHGMIVLGKTNMDEFGMGASGESSAYKITKNPIDTTRTAGGSSCGSAAAVASNQAPFALGSDTGGSVRQPSSFCGLVGIKPTYGSISRYGLVSFAPSLDQIGIISKTVEDNAHILNEAWGYDKKDATSIKGERPDCLKDIDRGVSHMTVALPYEIFDMDILPEIKEATMNTAELLRSLGCNIINCKLPDMEKLTACYFILSCAEASSNLARYDGIRYGNRAKEYGSIEELYINSRSEGFGEEVKRRTMLGTFALSSGYYQKYYISALRMKGAIENEYKHILKSCHAILTPTYPTTAFLLGEKKTALDSFKNDLFTVGANLSGLPSITLPVGRDKNSLPIGISLMGNYMDEPTLYRISNAIEGGLS